MFNTEENKKFVYYALKLAYSELGRPVTLKEIQDIALRYSLEPKRTLVGHGVFDWGDRILRVLKMLERDGKVEVWKELGVWVSVPIETDVGYDYTI